MTARQMTSHAGTVWIATNSAATGRAAAVGDGLDGNQATALLPTDCGGRIGRQSLRGTRRGPAGSEPADETARDLPRCSAVRTLQARYATHGGRRTAAEN